MKKFMNKKLAVIAVAVLLFSGSVTLYTALGGNSDDYVVNNFFPSDISTAVEENGNENENSVDEESLSWEPDSYDDSIYTAQKRVSVANVNVSHENNADAYIRVCMIPRWVYKNEDGTEVDVISSSKYTGVGNLTSVVIAEDNTLDMGEITFRLAEDWREHWIFNSNDGYFYYKKIVKPGESTTLLLDSLSISKDILDNADDGVYLKVDIISDSIQTVGGALESRWGSSGIEIDADSEDALLKLKEG